MRAFIPESDSGAIYSSWPNIAFHCGIDPISCTKSEWFKNYFLYVKDLLNNATVLIACMDHDPDHILGFAVINGTTLEWVGVKQQVRKNKIATLLLKNQKIDSLNEDNLTHTAVDILRSHPDLFKNKEEPKEDHGE